MDQMSIDLIELCPHRHYEESIGHVWCDKGGRVLWTDCGLPFFGEFAQCSESSIDNSPEACARRLEWYRSHK